mmetsp:Transcript_20356/g.50010  ORF Transcript_20356/g.50010 Transcript_20356/m.50010 type:complete len:239 (-) Transcript_20356:599-1315(-)
MITLSFTSRDSDLAKSALSTQSRSASAYPSLSGFLTTGLSTHQCPEEVDLGVDAPSFLTHDTSMSFVLNLSAIWKSSVSILRSVGSISSMSSRSCLCITSTRVPSSSTLTMGRITTMHMAGERAHSICFCHCALAGAEMGSSRCTCPKDAAARFVMAWEMDTAGWLPPDPEKLLPSTSLDMNSLSFSSSSSAPCTTSSLGSSSVATDDDSASKPQQLRASRPLSSAFGISHCTVSVAS